MKDPFLSQSQCNKRLLKDYRTYGQLVVGFDFDNTIYDYHKTGAAYPKVISILIEAHKAGFILVCYTANSDLKLVKRHCKLLGIKFHGINESPLFNHNNKPFFNVLLDDRAGLPSAYESLQYVLKRLKGSK